MLAARVSAGAVLIVGLALGAIAAGRSTPPDPIVLEEPAMEPPPILHRSTRVEMTTDDEITRRQLIAAIRGIQTHGSMMRVTPMDLYSIHH